ncbi:MAG TPA: SIS domain-containing protein [Chitinophagaceae bacterium]|nr:SIS domain-containing protein [Chitinophagaceae bacterium]
MNVIETYLDKCRTIANTVQAQQDTIQKVAKVFATTIAAGRMVHLFGSGHSRIMVEEMWPRYGSFPGFNPIVELSLTYHNNVVGANGQRQAMFLENVSGFAARILRNFDINENDAALIISSSGTNIVPLEMAEIFQQKNIPVASIITSLHSAGSQSKRADGKKLSDFSDYVLDTGAPLGDAMVKLEELDTPVAPGSTVGGAMIINCIKAEVARLLTEAGKPPKVLSSGAIVGNERAVELFESAYDEHAHRLSKLYQKVGYPSYVSG